AVLVAVQEPEAVERRRDVRPVGCGVRLGELALDRERLLEGLARLGGAALVEVQGPEGVESPRDGGPVGRGGRRGWMARARAAWAGAWAVASAAPKGWRVAAERCSSRCRSPRLLSVVATSGR